MRIPLSSMLGAMAATALTFFPCPALSIFGHPTSLSVAHAQEAESGPGTAERLQQDQQYGPPVDPYQNLGAPPPPSVPNISVQQAEGEANQAYQNFLDAQKSGDQQQANAAWARYMAAKRMEEQLQRSASP
jgi:hypothetical protein